MRKLDALHIRHPFKGSRRLRDDLWDTHQLHVNRKTRAAINAANGDSSSLPEGKKLR